MVLADDSDKANYEVRIEQMRAEREAAWSEQQSNIEFYDESSFAMMLGVQYRF